MPSQTTGSVRGVISDPSGATVANVTVALVSANGKSALVKTGRDGGYEFKGVPAGTYSLQVQATGFQAFVTTGIAVGSATQAQVVNVRLSIASEQQKVEVVANADTGLSVSPENNGGAIVLSGKDLEQLSDDPDQLSSDLTALAGPTVGSDGSQMYIDGYTAGQLPPKSAIREIRINQNPFSAEFDRLGYGRIEIFTKPGSEQFHGDFSVLGNESALNTSNPFLGAAAAPSYYTLQFNGDVSGPISKKASFFLDGQRRTINDVEVINAQLQPGILFTQAVENPRTRTNLGARVDYQASTNNTLTVRYQFYRDTSTNNGVGPYSLASRGYNQLNTEHTLQIGNTHTFGAKIVNETRFQYIYVGGAQTPLSGAPAVIVPYEFSGGGSSGGQGRDTQNHFEIQNYTSIAFGNHYLKFGARLRDFGENNTSTAGYNGTFTFASLAGYLANQPIQFSLVAGNPFAHSNLFDGGLYVQDDWRWKPNLTISTGLRFETQTDIPDHGDWAPRVGFAWGFGKGQGPSPKTVLRAGWGIFYSRFTDNLILQAVRQNGVTQQQFVVTNPAFYPNIPPVDVLQGLQAGVPGIYEIAPNLRVPYVMQTAVSVEHEFSKAFKLTVANVNSRGVHQLLTNNINAPLPGTYSVSDPLSGVRPNGILENIYQYQAEGIFRQNQLMANLDLRASAALHIYGYYALSYAHADTFGSGSSPTDPFNLAVDYGRASFDVRHRLYLGGNIWLPWLVRMNPFLVVNSGAPFNVTTPFDLNGDSILNDRPALVSDAVCPGVQTVGTNVLCTPLGTFNTLPAAGQPRIAVNAFEGPPQVAFNLRISKTFGIGPRREESGRATAAPNASTIGGRRSLFGGGPASWATPSSHRYTLTLAVNARNLFNTVNVSAPAGNLGSQKFDMSNSLAGGTFGNGSAVRMIQLLAQFNF